MGFPSSKREIFKLRSHHRLILGEEKDRSWIKWESELRAEVRGTRGGGNGSDGRVVELLHSMRGWHIVYPHFKAVSRRWLLALMTELAQQILRA